MEWTGFVWLRMANEEIYEHGNEPSYSTKCGEFLD